MSMPKQAPGAAGAAAGAGGSGGIAPVMLIPALALIAILVVLGLNLAGTNLVVPVNILAGFSYAVQPLAPALSAAILGYALWRYAGLGIGAVVIGMICIFALPIIVAFAVGYVVATFVPFEVASVPENFYGLLLLQTGAGAASLLLVLAICTPAFRNVWVWVIVLVIWSGGATLLFWMFRNYLIAASYPWLYQTLRVLGFVVIGYQFQRPLPAR
jgi:hypothetical protein